MSGFAPTDLIKEVRIRPGIYNREALRPPRREHRQLLWLEVAESLTPRDEWMNYTELEKETRISEISAKWRNLRDIFYREVKLLEAGEVNKKRKYVHYNEMEFVRPYIGYKQPPLSKRQNKSTNSSASYSKELHDDDSDIDMDEFIKSKNKVVDEDVVKPTRFRRAPAKKYTSKPRQNKQLTTSTPYAKRPQQKTTLIENFEMLKKSNVGKNPKFKIRESDISFCLSLVPTLQKMSDVRKLSVKIDILKILHKNMAQMEHNKQEYSAGRERSYDNRDFETDELIEECEDDDSENSGGNTKTWW